MISGPVGLRRIKGLHDESLAGSGRDIVLRDLGCNTGSFTEPYLRIKLFQVVSITAHDYRRR